MPELFTTIHRQVHELMAEGFVPTTLRVGWRQYGQLRELLSPGPDAPRPRSVLGLTIVAVDTDDLLEAVATDRRS